MPSRLYLNDSLCAHTSPSSTTSPNYSQTLHTIRPTLPYKIRTQHTAKHINVWRARRVRAIKRAETNGKRSNMTEGERDSRHDICALLNLTFLSNSVGVRTHTHRCKHIHEQTHTLKLRTIVGHGRSLHRAICSNSRHRNSSYSRTHVHTNTCTGGALSEAHTEKHTTSHISVGCQYSSLYHQSVISLQI